MFFAFLILVVLIGAVIRYVIVPQLGDRLPGKPIADPEEDIPIDEVFDPESIFADSDAVFEVHFIDVGQGDAIFIQTPTSNVLVDGGNKNSGVVEYLTRLAVDTLNILVSTHPHADHIGGLIGVLSSFTVMEVIDPGVVHTTLLFTEYLKLIDSLDIIFTPGRAGMKRMLHDNAFFEVLHPFEPSEKSLNDASIVLMLVFDQIKVLLTGDVEKKAESEMLIRYPDIHSQVLKVAHHGSTTSTSDAFLEAAAPEVAVIFCAENNKYGFPHAETLQKLSTRNINILRTDINGSVVLKTDGELYLLSSEKDTGYLMPGTSPGKPMSVDLNRASVEELVRVIHIGPARARQLIELRPLSTLDDLLLIQGIDEKRLTDIKKQSIAFVNQP